MEENVIRYGFSDIYDWEFTKKKNGEYVVYEDYQDLLLKYNELLKKRNTYEKMFLRENK